MEPPPPRFSLYFAGEPAELDRTEFLAANGKTIVAERAKNERTAYSRSAKFEWRTGVKALAILLLRNAAWARRGSNPPAPTLEGKAHSPANSLDSVLTEKAPVWVQGICGPDPYLRWRLLSLIVRTNQARKRKQAPVRLALDPEHLSADRIEVFHDECRIVDPAVLERMASQIERGEPAWRAAERSSSTGSTLRQRTRLRGAVTEPSRSSLGSQPTVPANKNTDEAACSHSVGVASGRVCLLPPVPPLVVGRDLFLQKMKDRLRHHRDAASLQEPQVLTSIRGWPGVGKTTVVAALAHDPEVAALFRDGILWATLGQHVDVITQLSRWARALGITGVTASSSDREASEGVAAGLLDREMLLIIDDAWEAAHVEALRVGGRSCAMIVTTREAQLAGRIAAFPTQICELGVLDEASSLTLLRALAPDVVDAHPGECHALARTLGGLPLALQIAGRMLRAEASYGWGVAETLQALQVDAARILEAEPPHTPMGNNAEDAPTVAALLRRSTDRLPREVRARFALLGTLAPDPATFDIEVLKSLWNTPDPRPSMRLLVDRGLVEPVGDARFRMHSLLRRFASLHAAELSSHES